MRHMLKITSFLFAFGGAIGCNHNVNLTLSTNTPMTVQNQCLTGVGATGTTVAVCGPSTWASSGNQDAVQPACLAADAVCPCQSYFTTPTAIEIDVTQNSTYSSNSSKINSVSINSITITGVQSAENSFVNSATSLTNATIIISDVTSGVTNTYNLINPITPLIGSNTYSPISNYLSPDPSSFLSSAISSGHPFTIAIEPSTTAAIDQCPIDIDFTFSVSVELNVKLL